MNGFSDKSQYIWQERGAFIKCSTNDCCIFRKTFNIEKKPKSATMHMFADSAYILYINGVKVRRMTAFSPDYPVYFDEDVAPYLAAGKNVIAVMCLYRGYVTDTSYSRTPALKAELEMIFSGDRTEYIYSDESFRVCDNSSYASLGVKLNETGGCIEYGDSRSKIYGWQNAEYDDSDWESAVCASCSRVFGKPVFLSAYPTETEIDAKAIIAAGAGSEYDNMPYPEQIMYETEDYHASLVYGLGSECEIKPLDKGDFSYITADFGKVISGFVRVEAESYGGDVIDVILSKDLKLEKPVISSLARFVARDGQNVFETYFNAASFRYVTLIFRNHIRTNVLKRISAYVPEGFLKDGDVEKSNQCICQLFAPSGGRDISCARFVLNNCIAPSNPQFVKDILDMYGFTQNGNGLIKPCVPGAHLSADRYSTVVYILTVCEFVEKTNDLDYARRCMNRLIAALDGMNTDETLCDGALTSILFLGAVKSVCGVAKKLDEKIIYEYLKVKAKKITKEIKKKYLSKSGVYCDGVDENGEPCEMSCDINAAAVLYIATKGEAKILCSQVLDYINKAAMPPSEYNLPMYVKALRMSGRGDIADFSLMEYEGCFGFYAAVI